MADTQITIIEVELYDIADALSGEIRRGARERVSTAFFN